MSSHRRTYIPYFIILRVRSDTVCHYSWASHLTSRFPTHGYVRCGDVDTYFEGMIIHVIEYQTTHAILAIELHRFPSEVWIAVLYTDLEMTLRRWAEWMVWRGMGWIHKDCSRLPLMSSAVSPFVPTINCEHPHSFYHQQYSLLPSYHSLCHPLPPRTSLAEISWTVETRYK
ncbi:hypothetical protein B0H21DRAFT_713046 [Amylocystis lapponica]|nr:hypothetical protein B0H21DRAFT_713046 [Amylocystis lapponica]